MAATSTATPGLTRNDRVLLTIFGVIAGALGALTLLRLVAGIRLYALSASSRETEVALLNQNAALDGLSTPGEPGIVFAAQPTTDLLVRGLDDGTRALLAGGEALSALVAVVVSVGIAWLFLSVARGKPFARSLQALALTAGTTLAVGSVLGQGLAGLGRMNAATALNAALGDDRFVVGSTFDPQPVVLGFAIIALTFVLRAGRRLQRDTEGLV